MICPKCRSDSTGVYDSRSTHAGRAIRRRRQCTDCSYRFTTIEEVKVLDLKVEKRNGQIVDFDQEKLELGVRKSFNKRPIDNDKFNKLSQQVIEDILELDKNPVKSIKIGQIVLRNLRNLDEAAYICYSAMYGNFNSVEDFSKLLTDFQKESRLA